MQHTITKEFYNSIANTFSRQIPYIGSSPVIPLKFKNQTLVITNVCNNEKLISAYIAVPLSFYKGTLTPMRKEKLLAEIALNNREDQYQGLIVVIQNIQFILTDKITLSAAFENSQGLQLSI